MVSRAGVADRHERVPPCTQGLGLVQTHTSGWCWRVWMHTTGALTWGAGGRHARGLGMQGMQGGLTEVLCRARTLPLEGAGMDGV